MAMEMPKLSASRPAVRRDICYRSGVLVASTETEPLSEQKRDLFSSLNSLAGWV
jgi:hypothetical protein